MFKPLTQRIADIDAEGKAIMYTEATYETGDTLPTERIYQGSWALNLTDKSVVFFNADTETWG